MAELSKLLTFMFKEDRSEILAHYNELFDKAEDEEALMREFGSPTKLAVSISRTYNRDERKLAVTADSKDDEVSESAAPLFKKPEPPKEAEPEVGSYAEIVEEFRRQRALEEGIEYTPIFFDEDKPEPEPEPDFEVDDFVLEDRSLKPEDEAEAAPKETVEEAEEVPDEPVEETEEMTEEAVQDTPSQDSADETEINEEPEVEAEAAPSEEEPETPAEAEYGEEDFAEEVEEFFRTEDEPEEADTVLKTNIPLLILYLIIAIPVGIVGLVLLVLIAAVVIVGAAVAAAVGIKLFAFAFSGLTVLADVFISGGIALMACGAALLLLWLGVWGLATGVPGIVVGLRRLGRKLCVREVSVNG